VRVRPASGCGTLQSPWTGWESQIEEPSTTRVFHLDPGFYEVSRPVRLPPGTALEAHTRLDGRAWFLPRAAGEPLDALCLVDGADRVAIRGVCFNGSGDRARHGILARGGTGLQIDECKFGDFGAPDGAALGIEGHTAERHVREVVIRRSRFVNGSRGIRLGPHVSDLLVVDNDFEEIVGPALLVDPLDHWSDYGLIFVKNRLRATKVRRDGPFVQLLAGAEGIRLAENSIEGPGAPAASASSRVAGESAAGVEVRGGGTLSTRRIEILLNRIHGTTGPGIAAFQCGPGLLAAGNQLAACGTESHGGVDVVACHGALVEDNEIASPPGPGIRAQDCSSSHLLGNEVVGSDAAARGGSVGVLVDGAGTRRLRVTDNRISGVRGEGLRVGAAHGLRLVGNEIQDCGEGIRVVSATNLLLVGNDCRDNGRGGIRLEGAVRRALVALNHAILNGGPDLVVRGQRVRCRANKVDRAGSEPEAAAEGSVSP
jgi:hypothetical protein